MPSIKLHFLGEPKIFLDDELVRLHSQQAILLLAYLCEEKRAVSREEIIGLFFLDRDEFGELGELRHYEPAQAKKLLRNIIYVLKKPLQDRLETGQHLRVQLERCESDFNSLAVALASEDPLVWEGALDLYRGPFLSALQPSAISAGLEHWLEERRHHWQLIYSQLLERLCRHYRHLSKAKAIGYAKRWLEQDPYQESIHKLLLELYAESGQIQVLKHHYRQLEELFRQQLQLSPSEELQSFYHKALKKIESKATTPVHNLTEPQDPLIGREDLLEKLESQFKRPECRLVHLLGSPGIGKSHLALHYAHQQLKKKPGYLADGIFWLNLSTLDKDHFSQDALAQSLATAMNLSQVNSWSDLLTLLASKQCLLIFDHLENIGVDILAASLEALLMAGPHIKVLLSSWQRFHKMPLAHAWPFMVKGLNYPQQELAAEAEELAAVKLFLYKAKQLEPFFQLADHRLDILKLCQYLQGHPLAIISAAELLIWYSPADIYQAFKTGQVQTWLKRQAAKKGQHWESLFKAFWQRLEPWQQQAMARLSIFEESFSADMALEVSQVDGACLCDLTEDFFLEPWEGLSHYRMHPLIHDYAAKQLTEVEKMGLLERLASYFIQQLQQFKSQINQRKNSPDIDKLKQDLIHIPRLLQELSDKKPDLILALAASYGYFCYRKNYIYEGLAALSDLVDHFQTKVLELDEAAQGHYAETLLQVGRFHRVQSNYAEAEKRIQEGAQLFEKLKNQEALAECYNSLGALALVWHKWALAEDYLLKALDCSTCYSSSSSPDDLRQKAKIFYNLGFSSQNRYQYAKAEGYFKASLAQIESYAHNANYIHDKSRLLSPLANLAILKGNYELALQQLQEALLAEQAVKNSRGVASMLFDLAQLHFILGDYHKCDMLLAESQIMIETVGDREALGQIILQRAWLYEAREDTKALIYAEEALNISYQLEHQQQTAFALHALSYQLALSGQGARAEQLCVQSCQIFKEADNFKALGQSYYYLALLHLFKAPVTRARALQAIYQSIDCFIKVCDDMWISQGFYVLAALSSPYEALLSFKQARHIHEGLGFKLLPRLQRYYDGLYLRLEPEPKLKTSAEPLDLSRILQDTTLNLLQDEGEKQQLITLLLRLNGHPRYLAQVNAKHLLP
ncbi:MAG: BTAD domain-containing putative transcriptional regulator [Deinococcales bacterium]